MWPIPEVSDLDIAFPSRPKMPTREEIPEVFWRSSNPWYALASKWFFEGLKRDYVDALVPKDGVDKQKALRAMQAILGSFEPKHEHKMAAISWLFSEWFEASPANK